MSENSNKDLSSPQECIAVYGAREHNLKNIDIKIPRNKLVVFTGLSGSGKSSLAFDTIFAEGQRRYMETFAAYARQYIGEMKRPDVDKIEGLSPVISIEQKSINKNPRSTVGTLTEIYDFLRLLYARIADAYSYQSGELMVRFTEQQLLDTVLLKHSEKAINIYAPLIKARKGHYRELFEQYRKKGYTKVRVDGKLKEIKPKMQLNRYSIHNIEVLIDRLTVNDKNSNRLTASLKTALKEGKGTLMVTEGDIPDTFYYSRNYMCPVSGLSYDEPQPNTFSFNSPYGACPECNGMGIIHRIDEETIIIDPDKSVKDGALAVLDAKSDPWTMNLIMAFLSHFRISSDTPLKKISSEIVEKMLFGLEEKLIIKTSFLDYDVKFDGLIARYKSIIDDTTGSSLKEDVRVLFPAVVCPQCRGARLKKEALFYRILDSNISDLASMELEHFYEWTDALPDLLDGRKKLIAHELLNEIKSRTVFLLDVGLSYLSLNRSVNSLSGGEMQRIRLATQIGSQLVNVTYIIDEPSIGLHPRDNRKLITALRQLVQSGNSVLVVEHDREMMMASDFLVDLGPGAGIRGGQLVYSGNVNGIIQSEGVTADYLSGRKTIALPKHRREGDDTFIEIKGAKGNNLKNIDVKIPLAKFICVTGVSGSGKSSLINETLYPILRKHLYKSKAIPLPYKSISGLEHIDKVIEIDQSPIGRTPRSNPSTYTGSFTIIRSLFSKIPEARIRAYQPGRFSFNVKGGRCEECHGGGVKIIEMNFLPDVYINCPKCMGQRYNPETLEVRYKGKSINDVLNMTHNQALAFFENIPQLKRRLKTMVVVGLGYITLGQSSVTLSGGEAQRVKLAAELAKKDTGKTLYILDEPTTGLHFEDIRILLEVLNKFVDKGNTVLIIEHNTDVIKMADHIIDMGPEGGRKGGKILCEGSPERIVEIKKGYTSKILAEILG